MTAVFPLELEQAGESFLCVRTEKSSAEIADICSFFPSSLEHCNAMRILSVWATSQTHWGTEGGWGGGVGKEEGGERRRKKEAEAVSKFTYSPMLQDTLTLTSGHTVIIYHDFREQKTLLWRFLCQLNAHGGLFFKITQKRKTFCYNICHIYVICN